VKAEISGHRVMVTPVLSGTAIARDIPTDPPVPLNLQDPDSMIFNPLGDRVLDSQADVELIIVHHPGLGDGVLMIWRLLKTDLRPSSAIAFLRRQAPG
jgi:hypothetical protein